MTDKPSFIGLHRLQTSLTSRQGLVTDLLLLMIFLLAIFFRFTGIFWGEYTYMHPDERFLIWVGTDITPMQCNNTAINPVSCPEEDLRWMTVGEYFDTGNSTLNPQNRNHGFYVYGNLPMTATRLVVQWIYGRSGFDEMTNVGRVMSSLADICTIFVVFLIGSKVYDRRVGLLAAAFLSATVLHIQQSHFFTMDTFITFFTILAFYFAILVSIDRREWSSLRRFWRHPLFLPTLFFGIALGMAVASKLNAFLMAAMLPVAMLIRLVVFPTEERPRRFLDACVFLVFAALTSFVVFRIFQPYAFAGPGFFNFQINPQWWDSIKSLLAQMSPDTDFPPAWQWARRSIFFSGQNLLLWGLGLPLGISAVIGFGWVTWRIIQSLGRNQEWQQHALLWVWTAAYFTYQSLAPNPTMRYQMPIYPTLVIFAAWSIIAFWDLGRKALADKPAGILKRWQLPVAILFGALALVGTFGWAYAFTRTYERPMTRVEATRWIFDNIPGPINLRIDTGEGIYSQPVPLPNYFTLKPNSIYSIPIQSKKEGELQEIYFPHSRNLAETNVNQSFEVLFSLAPNGQNLLSKGVIESDFNIYEDQRGDAHTVKLDTPVNLESGQTYYLGLNYLAEHSLPTFSATPVIHYTTDSGDQNQQEISERIQLTPDYSTPVLFSAPANAQINRVDLTDLQGIQVNRLPELSLSIVPVMESNEGVSSDFATAGIAGGGTAIFNLSTPVPIIQDAIYRLRLSVPGSDNALALVGDTVANEGYWDEGIPVRLDGYDPFGGIYPPEMELQVFWEDTPEKLDHLSTILDASDYIVISSNRRWGTHPRMPERYPMTTVYFRSLLGCPPDEDILWCYRVAQPGQFQGQLGFDLVKIFQSDPSIGPLRINDQFAEEAFTVYDHPKVMIFKKNDTYSSEHVRQLLGSVDFDKIIRKPPLQYESYPSDLLLPLERWIGQLTGGTWSKLFDTNALINRFQPLTVIVWYVVIFLIGLFAYPIVRAALPGLSDHGYPLARIAGVLIIAYLVWLAGSFRAPFTPITISLVVLFFIVVSIGFAIRQRASLLDEWKTNKRYYLVIELLFLGFFILDLLIRIGNPDIWHPYKGGEKPMDFAYFNAVLKSTTFPPFDPWYAGGYLNYYYFGFVLFGVLVKWLGIVPSVAYNLIIPTIFAMIALGAFSLAWNLYSAATKPDDPLSKNKPFRGSQFLSGLAGALGMALLGNQGTVRMIWNGFQRLGSPTGSLEDASWFELVAWGLRGFGQSLSGQPLPYPLGDWYWIPSRAIPPLGDIEPITEFPFFTVLYADLHAHLFALPITLLVLSFAVSIVLSRAHWINITSGVMGFFLGALAIGSLRPTNTWDFPTYLALSVIAFLYSIFSYYHPSQHLLDTIPILKTLSLPIQRLLAAAIAVLLLVGLSWVLFQPYSNWYALGYTEIKIWEGPRTPIASYLVHWGLFLFVIISWMLWQVRDWLDQTPVSALRKVEKYAGWISTLVGILFILTVFLVIKVPGVEKIPFGRGVVIALLALPLAALAGMLLLRPILPLSQRDAYRIVLFLIGTGFILTIMVEVIVLVGDIGRMNTVFKFYLQVWTLFSISAAASLGWLLTSLTSWAPNWQRMPWGRAWLIVLVTLFLGALLVPMMAGMAKVKDRMAEVAPFTLDGMHYMETATYDWKGAMDLAQDYRAIRWMQENVGADGGPGSPVIVEANLRDLYRWGSRFSIYTGLPSVVGWEWHQQQQRAINPGQWVSNRINEVDSFFKTIDEEAAIRFLEKYGVGYIILGQLERNVYPGLGLQKFEQFEGIYWDEVFRDQDTVIYKVIGRNADHQGN
jgi:YYY domain-containing protein